VPEKIDKLTQTHESTTATNLSILKQWLCEFEGSNVATQAVIISTKDAASGHNQRVPCFYGVESIVQRNSIQKLTSISNQVFKLLIGLLKGFKPRVYEIEEMLLIFLLKIKFALPFSALAAIYGKNESTISYNFYKILDILYARTQEFIFWPDIEDIKATMPECFRDNYPSCRVIIDCSEVKTEKPSALDQQNAMYSFYKSAHTIKFLVGEFDSFNFRFITFIYYY